MWAGRKLFCCHKTRIKMTETELQVASPSDPNQQKNGRAFTWIGSAAHCCAPGPINAISGIKGPTGMYS